MHHSKRVGCVQKYGFYYCICFVQYFTKTDLVCRNCVTEHRCHMNLTGIRFYSILLKKYFATKLLDNFLERSHPDGRFELKIKAV